MKYKNKIIKKLEKLGHTNIEIINPVGRSVDDFWQFCSEQTDGWIFLGYSIKESLDRIDKLQKTYGDSLCSYNQEEFHNK